MLISVVSFTSNISGLRVLVFKSTGRQIVLLQIALVVQYCFGEGDMHFPPREDVYERDCYPLNPQPLTGRLNAITFSLQMEMLRQKIYLFFFFAQLHFFDKCLQRCKEDQHLLIALSISSV